MANRLQLSPTLKTPGFPVQGSKPGQASVGLPGPLGADRLRRRLPDCARGGDADGDVGGAVAGLALDADEVVEQAAQAQAGAPVRLEVARRVDGAADVPPRAHRPELREGRRAIDGGRVDPPLHPHLVRAAVGLERPVARRVGVVGRVVHAEGLDHVVLDQRVARPPVQRQVRVAVDGELAVVRDLTKHQQLSQLRQSPCRAVVAYGGFANLRRTAGPVSLADDKVTARPLVPAHPVGTSVAADPGEVSILVGPVLRGELVLASLEITLYLLRHQRTNHAGSRGESTEKQGREPHDIYEIIR